MIHHTIHIWTQYGPRHAFLSLVGKTLLKTIPRKGSTLPRSVGFPPRDPREMRLKPNSLHVLDRNHAHIHTRTNYNASTNEAKLIVRAQSQSRTYILQKHRQTKTIQTHEQSNITRSKPWSIDQTFRSDIRHRSCHSPRFRPAKLLSIQATVYQATASNRPI